MQFNILEVKQIQLNYEVANPEALQEGSRVLMNIRVEIGNHIDDESLKIASVFFKLFLVEKDKEVKEELDEEEFLKSNNGFFITTYKVLFREESNNLDELELEIIRHLEPYVKKGILDFSNEVGLPAISLPFEFWKNVQKQG